MNVIAQDVQFVKEEVVSEYTGSPDGRLIGKLVGSAFILNLIFAASIHHEGHAAIRPKPVIGINPHVLALPAGILGNLFAFGIYAVGHLG